MTDGVQSPGRLRAALRRMRLRPTSAIVIAAVAALLALPGVILLCSSGCSDNIIATVAPSSRTDAAPLRDQPRVRVLLALRTEGGPTMSVRVNGPWTLLDARTHEIILEGAWMQSAWGTVIQGISKGVVVNVADKAGRKKTVHLPRARIMPKRPGTLCVNNRAYRGVLDIIPHDDGTMTLVNEVPMDDYIGGVVTAEMPFYWPAEALKAQAVVARTYCLALILERDKLVPRPDWDVEASGLTHQEYQGLPGEHPLGLAAVEATAGQVLMWDGQVFRAYFSSTCGGHTEACGLVWEDYPTIPPLTGGPCDHCKHSKYYQWTETIALADIERGLRKAGKDPGVIRHIDFADTNRDGHMDVITVRGQRQTLEMRGNDFRLAVGPSALKSLFFTARRAGANAWEFTGRGWGHGVGMCQYGAFGLAALAKKYDDILKYYYPKTEIRKAY
jgi:stage II sporulation protein D